MESEVVFLVVGVIFLMGSDGDVEVRRVSSVEKNDALKGEESGFVELVW